MKKFTLLLLILPVFLFSCDKIDDANTVEVDTTLAMNIPVTVDAVAAIVEKSTEADFPFSASKTYSLSENEDINDYLSKLKSIDITTFAILFSELQVGEEIKTVDISVTGAGVLASFVNVTILDNSPTPTINAANLVAAATILNSTKSITVVVSGTTNTGPMDFTVNIDLDVHVEAKAI